MYHITNQKRYFLVLTWLKNLIKLNYKKKFDTINLFYPLENFLTTEDDKHEITALKLQVYKIRIIQKYKEFN